MGERSSGNSSRFFPLEVDLTVAAELPGKEAWFFMPAGRKVSLIKTEIFFLWLDLTYVSNR